MTQDEIIQMAKEALTQEPREDWNSNAWVFADETLKAFAKLVAAKEREACAKVCDARAIEYDGFTEEQYASEELAAAIRERGQA